MLSGRSIQHKYVRPFSYSSTVKMGEKLTSETVTTDQEYINQGDIVVLTHLTPTVTFQSVSDWITLPLKQYEHFLNFALQIFHLITDQKYPFNWYFRGNTWMEETSFVEKSRLLLSGGQMCDRVAYFALSSELQFMAGSSFQVFS